MKLIPAGEFLMGRPETEADLEDDETQRERSIAHQGGQGPDKGSAKKQHGGRIEPGALARHLAQDHHDATHQEEASQVANLSTGGGALEQSTAVGAANGQRACPHRDHGGFAGARWATTAHAGPRIVFQGLSKDRIYCLPNHKHPPESRTAVDSQAAEFLFTSWDCHQTIILHDCTGD